MKSIFYITRKDLTQLVRNKMTFLFLLIMPIVFTLLFGYAFGGFGSKETDPRLPVGFVDLDKSIESGELIQLLKASSVVRLADLKNPAAVDLEKQVSKKELAAGIIIPAGYGEALKAGSPMLLKLIDDPASTSSMAIENEIVRLAARLASISKSARSISAITGVQGTTVRDELVTAWQSAPVAIVVALSTSIKKQSTAEMSIAHTAPGMMLQFAIASLLTAAQILVNERKSRSLQRLLTTRVSPWQILTGHFLAIFVMLFVQFTLLIAFGQLVLGLDYLRLPLGTFLMTLAATACIASLGLLIGTFAKSDEQAVVFSLIPMFVLAGLGGAWVPLEVTGSTFQTIGHLSPVAWGMDGFKNITARGLGMDSLYVPAMALLGYAVIFFGLAAWKFSRLSE